MKEIPKNIGEYVEYDETSSTGIRWIKLYRCKNQKSIGDEAGSRNKKGYYILGFNNRLYFVHRIVFFLHYNNCPNIIDHIDNNPSNNKIENLRAANKSENQHNRKINKNNKSGCKGLNILTSTSGKEYWHCKINNKYAYFRKDSPNSRQLAEQWLIDNRENLHGNFTNHG